MTIPDDLLQRALAWARGASAAPDDVRELAIEVSEQMCMHFESFFSLPYLDPVGIPTIGYGATHYLDGRKVTLKDAPISETTARRLLRLQIERIYLPAVMRQCPGVRDPYKLAALIDFTFNLGEGNLQASTLRRKVNAGLWDEVPAQLMRWVYAAGRKLRGLVLRRSAEVDLVKR